MNKSSNGSKGSLWPEKKGYSPKIDWEANYVIEPIREIFPMFGSNREKASPTWGINTSQVFLRVTIHCLRCLLRLLPPRRYYEVGREYRVVLWSRSRSNSRHLVPSFVK
jgi:hypothetical protein